MKHFIITAIALVLGIFTAVAEYPRPYKGVNGQFGYVNHVGQTIVKPKYDNAYMFREGFARVELRGKTGFLDARGRVIAKPIYEAARDFNYGYALVKRNGKWGAINEKGKEVIPCQYDTEGEIVDVKMFISDEDKK